MSFGFSITDITSLIRFVTRAYQGWKDACGEHAHITGELKTLRIILIRVSTEIEAPSSLLGNHDEDRTQLQDIAGQCVIVVNQLYDVVSKYKGLKNDNLRRFQLGKKDLSHLRDKLTLQITALGTYLDALNLSALGRMEKTMLPDMIKSINNLATEIRAGRRESSVITMTTYESDEKDVWREFRRELIREGFTSESLKRMKRPLKTYLKTLQDGGLLEEEAPEDGNCSPLIDQTRCGSSQRETNYPSAAYEPPTVESDISDFEEHDIQMQDNLAFRPKDTSELYKTNTVSELASQSNANANPISGSGHMRNSSSSSTASACSTHSQSPTNDVSSIRMDASERDSEDGSENSIGGAFNQACYLTNLSCIFSAAHAPSWQCI